MLTEDDALKKWCPYARVLVDLSDNDRGPTSANRLECAGSGGVDLEWMAPRCIASECMAWRWRTTQREEGGTIWEPTGPYQARGVNEHLGFCGLAGKS